MIAISLSRGTDMGVTLEDTQVMFLRADGGPARARAAFEQLEAKMTDWASRLPEIGNTFMAMADREKSRVDTTRPSIEFYRSQRELILFLPVTR